MILLEDKVKTFIVNIKDNFDSFNKHLLKMKEFKDRFVSGPSVKDYKNFKNDLNLTKNNISKELNNIENILKKLLVVDIYDDKLNNERKSILTKIKEKLPKKKEEFISYLNEIEEKEGKYLSIPLDDSISVGSAGVSSKNSNQINDGKIQICEYNGYKLLEDRQSELESLRKVSAQVVDITQQMKTGVFLQGESLRELENNIVEVKTNTKNAENEVKEVNDITKKQNKRVFCLVLIIVILLGIISLVVFNFIKSKN